MVTKSDDTEVALQKACGAHIGAGAPILLNDIRVEVVFELVELFERLGRERVDIGHALLVAKLVLVVRFAALGRGHDAVLDECVFPLGLATRRIVVARCR